MLTAVALASSLTCSTADAQAAGPAGGRTVVTSAEQLPRRSGEMGMIGTRCRRTIPVPHRGTPPMADDVTRKDLQSLQGYVNKQIADLEKRLKAEINGCIKDYESRTNSLMGDVNQINQKLAELAKSVEQLKSR